MVSTYLLLVFVTLLLMISFLSESMKINYLNEKKISLLTQSNIIANRLAPYFLEINSSYVNQMVEEITKKLSLDINSRVMVSDLNQKILIDSYDKFKGETLDNEELKLALSGKNAAKQHILKEYGRVMYVAVPITYQGNILGAVFVSSSLEEIYDNIKRTLRNFIILSLFSLLITGIISFIFADIISSPIENLTEIVKKTAQGKFNQKVDVKGNDEISNLGKAFNIMTTKLEQVDKQRREFVANVSHELRTPLSSIKILAESLINQDEKNLEIYREFLIDIDSEVDRLNKIIDSLLYLVDLEKENLDLDYQITYVNYLIGKVINNLKPIADKKNIELIFKEDKRIQISLDQIKIQQVLFNVIGNAIKYTPERGRVLVKLFQEQNDVVISVKDNGIGISEKELPFIFDRFYRVDKARSRDTGGSGLGLSISQQIVALHQGRIEVLSKLNEGTEVKIFLPAQVSL